MNNVNTVTRPSREEIAAKKKTSSSVQWFEYQADLLAIDTRRLSERQNIPLEEAGKIIRHMERSGCY